MYRSGNRPVRHFVVILFAALASASLLLAQPVLNPANGHYYEVIDDSIISWTEANLTAATLLFESSVGYLATITSAEEEAFLLSTFTPAQLSRRWLGGSQGEGIVPADAGWAWVTGEEWLYTHWALGEPNDFAGAASEQYVQTAIVVDMAPLTMTWLDVANSDAFTQGYIVEYELLVIDAELDIKDGSVNCTNSRGMIPMSLLSSDALNAYEVDRSSITFHGASPAHRDRNGNGGHFEDADADGLEDLVLHFRLGSTDLTCEATEGTLEGMRLDELPFSGTDSIRMHSPPGRSKDHPGRGHGRTKDRTKRPNRGRDRDRTRP
jgi:hypothetical protein